MSVQYHRYTLIIAIGLGAIVPLSFAPMRWFLPIWISLIGFFMMLYHYPKHAWMLGWLYGLGMFGTGVSWIYVSIHVYGHMPAWLAIIITLMFVAFMAQFIGWTTWLMQRYAPLRPTLSSIAGLAGLWVLLEWSRSWLLTGFPWLQLGYSQTNTLLGYGAPYIGSYGISFLLLIISGLIWLSIIYRKQITHAIRPLILLIIILSLLFIGQRWSWTQTVGPALRIALIQGNIPQDDKWHPYYEHSIINTYLLLSQPHWGMDLIVWPESAIPVPLERLSPVILKTLQQQAHTNQTDLLTGIPMTAPNGYYNSLLHIGSTNQSFHKTQLVPFGEYIPMKRYLQPWIEILAIPMTDFLSGPAQQSNLTIKHTTMAPFICYEIAYSTLVRQRSQQSHGLLTLSNDAWFGHSFAPGQHLQIGQIRAMETQRYHLFSTNDGITAIIGPDGTIHAQAPQGQATAVTGDFLPRQGQTPWQRFGDWPILSLAALGWLWAIRQHRVITNI